MLIALRARAALVAVALSLPPVALCQVGHPPTSSPFTDLKKGNSFTFIGGRFEGNGGRVGVGPNSGYTFGIRYDLRAGQAFSLGVGLEHGNLTRLVVDPKKPVDQRVVGSADQSVTFAEALFTLNLTGGKTWHGFAPFVGLAGGLAFASSTPADTSGFDFGRKIFFAPATGFRLFLGDRLHLRAEIRGSFWKLKYPASFRQDPVNPVTLDATEWNLSPWFLVGFGLIL